MITTNVPDVVDEETGFYPPLGLLSVAAHARENTDWEMSVVDSQVEKLSYEDIRARVARERPDVVGIQCLTFTLIDAIATARIVKELDKGIIVCLGGPHVSIFPDESISFPEVDYLVLGEGEITFTELLRCLEKNRVPRDIPGLIFRHRSEIVRTGVPALIQDLDILPMPARDLVPYQLYYSALARERPVSTIMSSRGCPSRCIYCDRPHLGKKFRAKSAGKVVDEMEDCARKGIRELFFYDDTFSVRKKRVLEICDEIERRGVQMRWDIRARVDMVSRETLKRLKSAGCVRIHFGVESGNNKILKILQKGITVERARQAFDWARQEGITTLAYFMIGSPGEREEEVEDSVRLARKLDPDFVHFSVTTPFPATRLYTMAMEQGIVRSDVWREFAADPREDFVPPLWDEYFTREELTRLLFGAYRNFYNRPSYLLRQTLKVRSLDEFYRKVKAGIRIMRLRDVKD